MIDDEKYDILFRYASEKDTFRAVKLWSSKDSSKSPISFGEVLLNQGELRLLKLIEVVCRNDLTDLLAVILKTWALLQTEYSSNRHVDTLSQHAGAFVKIAIQNELEGTATILEAFFPLQSREEKARYVNRYSNNVFSLARFKELFLRYTEYLPVCSFLLSMCLALVFSIIYSYYGLNQSLMVHGLNILGQVSVGISCWLVWNTDPGYLSCPTSATNDLASYLELLSSLEIALSQGIVRSSKAFCCHICRHPRPLRAGHSVTTNKCVRVYDHFCTFLYRDIGKNNYVYFLSYLFTMSAVCIPQFLRLTALFLREHMSSADYDQSALLLVCKTFTVWSFLIWLFIAYLLCLHLYLSCLGLTSREWKHGAVHFPYISDAKVMKKAKLKDIYLKDYL